MKESGKYFVIQLAYTKEIPFFLKASLLVSVATLISEMLFALINYFFNIVDVTDSYSIRTKMFRVYGVIFGCVMLIPWVLISFYDGFFKSYQVTGEMRFFEQYVQIVGEKELKLDYGNIKNIEIDYWDYERIDERRISGAKNQMVIRYNENEEYASTFLCRKKSDIIKIEKLLLYLNKQRAIMIVEKYKGKEVATYR